MVIPISTTTWTYDIIVYNMYGGTMKKITNIIALKFLFNNKMQTLLMIIGISIGVAAQILSDC